MKLHKSCGSLALKEIRFIVEVGMKFKPLLTILCAIGFTSAAYSQEATSQDSDRMQEFLARFPKSDLNSNGVLTLDEMHDYLDKKIKDGATSTVKGKKLISRIYLREILEKTPASDLNKDGVLTKEELLRFVKMQKENTGPGTTVARA